MPHVVKNEMCKCAEWKSEEPRPGTIPIKVNSSNSDQDEKKKCMAKNPAVTKGFSKEEMPYWFINDVRQK